MVTIWYSLLIRTANRPTQHSYNWLISAWHYGQLFHDHILLLTFSCAIKVSLGKFTLLLWCHGCPLHLRAPKVLNGKAFMCSCDDSENSPLSDSCIDPACNISFCPQNSPASHVRCSIWSKTGPFVSVVGCHTCFDSSRINNVETSKLNEAEFQKYAVSGKKRPP